MIERFVFISVHQTVTGLGLELLSERLMKQAFRFRSGGFLIVDAGNVEGRLLLVEGDRMVLLEPGGFSGVFEISK